ncbi:MAG TPA: acido-empty-quinoprotein group A [Candidatus Acidoferrum sp.]|jgi:acido-empty-quinoprotein group A|nr:acido-empty-quinoprotein group A [Candidatus Acidoferrum sp.]
MKTRQFGFALLLCLLPAGVLAQGADKSVLLKPPADSWPTHHGDYSARRYSSLKTINDTNVQDLSLDWMARVTGGIPADQQGGRGGSGNVRVSGSPLLVGGVLYFTANDNAWAMDAHSGRVLWHYFRESTGEEPVTANKGMGMYGNWLYFITRDNFLVSLDATTGEQRWVLPVADPKQYYFSTMAPIVIGNHVIVGTGGDSLDLSGFLQSRDPETGEVQWTHYNTPREGEPGIETWPSEYAAAHGGGGAWVQGAYDPELNLYYYGTANPNPVYSPQSRKGADLYTSSIIAINPDTGKMAWYFQASPHDTHDWDAACDMVLIDGVIDGKPRKLLAHASRNGYFFVLDRTNGKSIVSAPFVDTLNWSKGLDQRGQPIPDPAKEPSLGGSLAWPNAGSATNWPPPSFSPLTGLFYVGTEEGYGVFYLSDTDDHPQGYGGIESALGTISGSIKALDYKTGKVVWRHVWPGGGGAVGMLSTAGNLLFVGNQNNLVAFNSTTGKILWHAGLLAAPNAPMTFMLDGRQHVLVAAGDTIYSFVLNQTAK